MAKYFDRDTKVAYVEQINSGKLTVTEAVNEGSGGGCNVPEGLNNVARIYAANGFSLALKNDGTVVAWGSNNYGQCDVPAGLNGVVDICVGGACVALKSNGTVVVWGSNNYGRRNVPAGLHDVVAVSNGSYGVVAIKTDGTVVNWGYAPRNRDLLTGLSKVLNITKNDIVIFRDGTLSYCGGGANADVFNAALEGLNVLSGHYFAVKKAKLLNPAGQVITSVGSQGGYRIEAQVANNYASPTSGLAIIQVLGCVGLSGDIPVTGSTVSSDFTMPSGISGKAYVDVFVWDGWDTMVPRAKAKQDLSFSVTQ